MSLALMLLVTLATLLQLAVTPLLVADPARAPLIPVALLAAWGVNRNPEESWPAVIPAALLPGIISTQRAAWFLLALLPVVVLTAALTRTPPADERHPLRRLPATAAVAALGALGHVLVLALASGHLIEVASAPGVLATSAIGSALLATALAPILMPRRERRGLFA